MPVGGAESLHNQSLADGAIAQLGERFHGMEEVVGSIPTSSTNTPSSDLPSSPLNLTECLFPGLSDHIPGSAAADSGLRTSRTQVNRLLDPASDVTVSSLQRAAALVGRRLRWELL